VGTEVEAATADPVWLEPYPDLWLTGTAGSSPEARYEQRESVELAFLVAMQRLPPRQRAVLLLRDVIGFSVAEISSQLGTSVPAVNSALPRARATTHRRMPARSQQSMLRDLGNQRTREIVQRYTDAMERGDADTMVSMLTEDAAWSMPPHPTWFQGRRAIRDWLIRDPFGVHWKHLPARANGQLAVGCYVFDQDKGDYTAGVIDVLTLDGDRIAAVTGFVAFDLVDLPEGRQVTAAELFARFGLPARLP
jgi:RNA polymerase sigma-70 factor (ECF subfamily)